MNETIPAKLETMIPQIAAFCKGHKLHCDFFELADKDLVRLIESSDANPDHFVDELLDSQSLLLAVCSKLPEEQISHILKQRFRELDKYTLHNTRNWILSQLSKNKDKIFEVADLNSVLISLDNLDSNKGLLLSLRPRPHLFMEREKLRQAAVMIQAMSNVI